MMEPDKMKDLTRLREILQGRGIRPEPYIEALRAFERLVDSITTHDQFEVVTKVIEAMDIVLHARHVKFHEEGGQNEKKYSDYN